MTVGYVSNGWGRTWYFNGKIGYFSCDYIEKVEGAITSTPPGSKDGKKGDYNCKIKATANLNIREGRGTTHPVISTVAKGTEFTVGYVSNGWGRTWNFNGKIGYFSCDYI